MLLQIRTFFGKEVDNSSLVLFRMFFGFLVACETYGAILTGWVNKTFVEPDFTFTFINFNWLQPLEGNGMIFYFIAMGTCGLMIMLGLFYRFASVLFFILWTGAYVMQKSEYNNHYYLLVLLSAVMAIMPAHKNRSLDVKFGFAKREELCPNICIWFFIIQILIVYVFASLNKVNADWLAAKPIGIWFSYKTEYWLIGPLLAKQWFQYLIAWGGVFYDGLIFFILLYKPTRKLGFILSLVFNLFNSAVFHIGIFPYLMIALTIFFYPPEQIGKIFFKKHSLPKPTKKLPLSPVLTTIIGLYFVVQLYLPIRHHFYEGDAHWTEEGHRMAWQMMLRTKSGNVKYDVVHKETLERTRVNLKDHLTRNQIRSMIGEPDVIWQFAQHLKKFYMEEGQEVAVYAITNVSLNGGEFRQLIDKEVDLASVPWETFKHSDWILTYPND